MPEDERDFRRLPAVERSVSGIKPEDMRVSLLGTVVDKQDNSIVLDDGTGKVNVNFEGDVNVGASQLVRVMGRVIPIENGFEIQGEVAQDMSGLDLGLHKRVKEIWDKLIPSSGD